MLEKIKLKCGIALGTTIYDGDTIDLINSAKADLYASGVLQTVIKSNNEQVLNAIACYVKAYRGSDRTDTDKYLKLYRDLRLYLQYMTEEDLATIEALKVGE